MNIPTFLWGWGVNVTIPCRYQELLPFLSVMYFSYHPSPLTILPSSLTSSCHLFLGLPLNLVVPKFVYNTLLGILFSSIPCPCPNQRNLQDATYYKKFHKVYQDQHPRHVAKWQLSQCFKHHLCPHHQVTDEDRDCPPHATLLTIQPPDMAASLRIFYGIQLL